MVPGVEKILEVKNRPKISTYVLPTRRHLGVYYTVGEKDLSRSVWTKREKADP